MAEMRRIAAAMERAKREGRAAFIPYLTAGDPDFAATRRFLEALAAAGADVVELGVPFSDPIADGPVNQRAAERALRGGTTLAGILELISGLRRNGFTLPLMLFSYYNPIVSMGLENFARRAAKAGVDGALAVDLPPEEAGSYLAAMRDAGLDTVFLASPTTQPERLRRIDEASSAFVYYVSRLGVTGVRAEVSSTLEDEMKNLRRHVRKPVAVGFGISTPEQAAAVANFAEGVVVGSALVRCIEEGGAGGAAARMQALASSISAALKRHGSTPS